MKRLFDVKCTNKVCKNHNEAFEIFTKSVANYICPVCGGRVVLYHTKPASFELKGDGFYKEGRF